jgi:hypothetical protein
VIVEAGGFGALREGDGVAVRQLQFGEATAWQAAAEGQVQRGPLVDHEADGLWDGYVRTDLHGEKQLPAGRRAPRVT